MEQREPQLLIDRLGEDASAHDRLVTVWTLRLLIRGKGYQRLVSMGGSLKLEIAELVGIESSADAPDFLEAIGELRRRLEALEAEPLPYPDHIEGNVAAFADYLGLSRFEADVAAFAALADCVDTLSSAHRLVAQQTTRGVSEVIAAALNADPDAVGAVLAPEAPLRRAGVLRMVSIERREGPEHTKESEPKEMEVLRGLGKALLSRQGDLADFFRGFVCPVDDQSQPMLDFGHVQDDVKRLTAVLAQALAAGETGTNVLIYGPPGVGKTALACTVGERIGAETYEIPTAQSHSEASLHGRSRFNAANLGQYLLAGRDNALLIFDDVEDVFALGPRGAFDDANPSSGVTGKGWTNRLLERSPVPTIWISNSLKGLDRAFLRRFDYVIPLRHPPQPARRGMLERALTHLPVSSAWIERQAASEGLTPAQIQQAARVGGRLQASLDAATVEDALETQLIRHKRLQGYKAQPARRDAAGLTYELDLVTAELDPKGLIDGLAASGQGSVLMYGPPGTGKTAFAHAVAERLERPLIARRASQLLSC